MGTGTQDLGVRVLVLNCRAGHSSPRSREPAPDPITARGLGLCPLPSAHTFRLPGEGTALEDAGDLTQGERALSPCGFCGPSICSAICPRPFLSLCGRFTVSVCVSRTSAAGFSRHVTEAEEEQDRRGRFSSPRKMSGVVRVGRGSRAAAQSCQGNELRRTPGLLGGGSQGCASLSPSLRPESGARTAAPPSQGLPKV